MINKSILLATIFFTSLQAGAQVFTNKEVGKKSQDIADSLKQSEYPYSLPIWGAKATKAGYNLPYSAGVSVNYLWQESDIIIENRFREQPVVLRNRSKRPADKWETQINTAASSFKIVYIYISALVLF